MQYMNQFKMFFYAPGYPFLSSETLYRFEVNESPKIEYKAASDNK